MSFYGTIEGHQEKSVDPPGRSCPLTYRYQPEALAQPAQLRATEDQA